MNFFLNSDDGPSDHIISWTAPQSSKWFLRKSTNTATVSLPLSWLSDTIRYVLHTILLVKSMWKAWHSVSNFDTHKSNSLQIQFVKRGHWALWICLVLIWVRTMSHSLTKLSKSSTTHFESSLETYYQYVSILCIKHSFQDQYLLSPFCHLHNPHNSLTSIVNLWCYCIKQCPKMNRNHIKQAEPLTY